MRYLQLIFVFVFVFIGLINVIFRIVASNRKKRGQSVAFGNLTSKKKKDKALLPGETREYSEYKVEKIDAEPADGITGAAVPGLDTAGLILGSDAEKPVLTRDTAAGGPERPMTGQTQISSSLETETLPGYKRSPGSPEITERIDRLSTVSAQQPTISVKDQRQDKITAWERINKLSILKRAVVLSEILGPPKGSV